MHVDMRVAPPAPPQRSIVRVMGPPTPERLQSTTFAKASEWVRAGKLLRVRSFDTAAVKALADFAASHRYQFVHFDARWYGPENDASMVATAVHPSFKDKLDLAEVVRYAHSLTPRIGVCLYVNELALRDTDKLATLYASWGIDCVKLGFVRVRVPSEMRTVHDRVLAFAKHGITVDVHDYYRPRSFSRTWPSLLTQEGVRGEERSPDCGHHTMLPFVRLLAGAADYTPRFGSRQRCSKAHQLALPIIIFSPIQSLFWSEEFAEVEAMSRAHPALKLWSQLPTTWQDTRALGGVFGQWVSIARRSGESWFVGTVTGGEGRTMKLDIKSLFDDTHRLVAAHGPSHPTLPAVFTATANGEGFVLELWSDGAQPMAGTAPAQYAYLSLESVKALLAGVATPTVALPDKLQPWATSSSGMAVLNSFEIEATLAPSGGHCMHIMPLQRFLLTHARP